MSYADKTLSCRDCGQDFVFTSGEQDFFAQEGFNNNPSRCPICRASRRGGQGSSPGGYDAGGYSSGGGGYSPGGGGGYGRQGGPGAVPATGG